MIAGLSAGGFGAVDIALHRPELFGAAESWSGYFRPLDDDPFKGASKATLAANNPMQLVRRDAAALRHAHLRLFLSTGPYHSHLFAPAETDSFARELRSLRLPVTLVHHPSPKGQWRAQLDAGLLWALAP